MSSDFCCASPFCSSVYVTLPKASSLLATHLTLPPILSLAPTNRWCLGGETGWAVPLHSQGCTSKDAAAQLQGPHRFTGGGRKDGRSGGRNLLPSVSKAAAELLPACSPGAAWLMSSLPAPTAPSNGQRSSASAKPWARG